jgi:hypothetical protein
MQTPAAETIVIVAYKPKSGKEADLLQAAVIKLWERYASVCDYVPLVSLPESSTQFASFTPLAL